MPSLVITCLRVALYERTELSNTTAVAGIEEAFIDGWLHNQRPFADRCSERVERAAKCKRVQFVVAFANIYVLEIAYTTSR